MGSPRHLLSQAQGSPKRCAPWLCFTENEGKGCFLQECSHAPGRVHWADHGAAIRAGCCPISASSGSTSGIGQGTGRPHGRPQALPAAALGSAGSRAGWLFQYSGAARPGVPYSGETSFSSSLSSAANTCPGGSCTQCVHAALCYRVMCLQHTFPH